MPRVPVSKLQVQVAQAVNLIGYTGGIKAQTGRFHSTLIVKSIRLGLFFILCFDGGIGVTLVGIVMGSDSDLKLMEQAIKMLEEFEIPFEVVISSAHRAPLQTAKYAESAEERGLEVIIAAAGAAAHLPGVIAASTPLPVIGVPVKSGALSGLDALYAIVQMPAGIPVATVGVDGAKNAAILAAEILGVKYPEYRQKIKTYKQKLSVEVESKNQQLQEKGWRNYAD